MAESGRPRFETNPWLLAACHPLSFSFRFPVNKAEKGKKRKKKKKASGLPQQSYSKQTAINSTKSSVKFTDLTRTQTLNLKSEHACVFLLFHFSLSRMCAVTSAEAATFILALPHVVLIRP